MRTTSTTAVAALAIGLALPAAGAGAATTTFTATFEAERTIEWDQPRGVSLKDCRGEHWLTQGGEETWKVRSSRPFKVVVTTLGRGTAMWQIGDPPTGDIREYGVAAKGPRTRTFRHRAGTTGGWCGGGAEDPPLQTDCGTKLGRYLVIIGAARREIGWSMSPAPDMANERLDFYNCTIVPPSGLPSGSFPSLIAKAPSAKALRSRKTITVQASKSYGPVVQPVANVGVDRTLSGEASWKLVLKRAKRR